VLLVLIGCATLQLVLNVVIDKQLIALGLARLEIKTKDAMKFNIMLNVIKKHTVYSCRRKNVIMY
jgi:hypothetical protein